MYAEVEKNWGTDNLSTAIVAKNRYGRQEKQQKL